jgi:hypothetical protein
MRAWVVCALVAGCGRAPDFQVPPRGDLHMLVDLAVSLDHPPPEAGCFNTACGGCSSWARPAYGGGAPAQPGDPCGWNGMWGCTGTTLGCSSTACPACAGGMMTGSVCGADGHTVLELVYAGGVCGVYDFGSILDLCTHDASDRCVGRCVKSGASYACTAGCTSYGPIEADGGVRDGGVPVPHTGCPHAATDTCDSLTSC